MSKNDKNIELIPVSSLRELYDAECKKIEELLSTSKILHDNSKYQESIFFSIIALEEIYKLTQIVKHQKESNGFSEKQWNDIAKMGSHNKKLSGAYDDAIKQIERKGEKYFEELKRNYKLLVGDILPVLNYKEIISSTSEIILKLEKLNKIKQSILYCDWDKCTSKPFSLSILYDNKILKDFSTFLYNDVDNQLLGIKLDKKYPPPPLENLEMMKKDEMYLKKREYYQKLNDSDYKKIICVSQSIIKIFPNPIPKNILEKIKL